MSSRGTVRLGAGAGFAGDRIDPAVELAERADLDYLVFECLGERTVAGGQLRRLHDPRAGYDPMLAARMRAVLPVADLTRTRIITNSGAANPLAAADVVADVAHELGRQIRVATVTGDDVLEEVRGVDPVVWETGERLSVCADELVSANAYLGSDGILAALAEDPHIVITGRAADPSLYVGPLLHELGWDQDDWPALGRGTVIGHLLECAGQLTGGYFADPVTKPVPDMARLGFPFAEVSADGEALLTKLQGTGGRLDVATCTEQLLYEVDNPASYLTPDVSADFTGVAFEQVGADAVRVSGATGNARPDDLKVSLGFRGGWLGEGQISYAGPRALARARLAAEIVSQRLVQIHGIRQESIAVEMIGAGAAFRGLAAPPVAEPPEVRLRVSASTRDAELAQVVGWEVEALYTNGPAGGGGAQKSATERVKVRSCLLPRDLVQPAITVQEVR